MEAVMKKQLIFIVLLGMLSACSPFSFGSGSATTVAATADIGTVIPDGGGTRQTPTPEPTVLVPVELKYRVLDEFPDFFFCDPDFYPVARENEMVLAQQRFPELQADQNEFQVILDNIGLSGTASFTDDQKLLVYREHKKLNAIHFEKAGDKYKFQIQTGSEGQQGIIFTGTIDANGSIDILQRDDGFPTCPICLAAGTLIDTPQGAIPVEDLRVGDSVWTVNERGERVSALLVQVGSVRVPANHQVIDVTLSDSRHLRVSPGHPTADGRFFTDLKVGDVLDGAQIIHLELTRYTGTSTFDILPSGITSFYWANGILVGSTLKHNR
jgi:hypothetical protein